MKWYPCTPYFSFWGKPTKIIFCLDVMGNACNFLKQLSENNILLIENSQLRLQLRNFDRRNGISDTLYPKFYLFRKEKAWKLSERTIFSKPHVWKVPKCVSGFKQSCCSRNTLVPHIMSAKPWILPGTLQVITQSFEAWAKESRFASYQHKYLTEIRNSRESYHCFRLWLDTSSFSCQMKNLKTKLQWLYILPKTLFINFFFGFK